DALAQRVFSLRLSDLILERASDDPGNFLDKAYQLLRRVGTLDDPLRPDRLKPRPAELHFLAMLRRDRAPIAKTNMAYFELLQRALRLRRMAERAALALRPNAPAYSEQVFPWIR